LVLNLITLYKRYLSPLKGFRCAYGVYHGGNSCSTEIYELIDHHGLIKGFTLARLQLQKCSLAYIALSADNEDESEEKGQKKKPEKKEDKFSWCELPCYTLDCLSIARCRSGKNGEGLDCDAPCDCSP